MSKNAIVALTRGYEDIKKYENFIYFSGQIK